MQAFFAEAVTNPAVYMRIPGEGGAPRMSAADAPFVDAAVEEKESEQVLFFGYARRRVVATVGPSVCRVRRCSSKQKTPLQPFPSLCMTNLWMVYAGVGALNVVVR